jgi:protein-ribulosamine 3-kinase
MNPSLEEAIAQKLKIPTTSLQYRAVGGGCINQTFLLSIPGKNIFCKVNNASNFPQMLAKEGNALKYFSLINAIKTPKVFDHIETGAEQALLLEWINRGSKTAKFWKSFGQQLAALHLTSNHVFGWEEDNYMGSVVQHNTWTTEWTSFFTTQRLIPLVQQCSQKGLLSNKHLFKLEHVYKELNNIFSSEPPALLHGDLWSGNFMCNEDEEPVLIDPAIYYGHRSIDLGMTTLFGGFDRLFYEAYHHYYPFPSNYSEQWKVCNLYPLLIHLLLFGSSYRLQIEDILQEFE